MVKSISTSLSSSYSQNTCPIKKNYLSLNFISINKHKYDNFSFKGEICYTNYAELFKKIIGRFTKEDEKLIRSQIDKLVKQFDENNVGELISRLKAISKEVLSLLDKFGLQSRKTDQGLEFVDNAMALNKKQRKKIKLLQIQHIAIFQTIKRIQQPGTDPLLDGQTIKDWFGNIGYNSKSPNLTHSLFKHPIEQAKSFISTFTESEQKIIETKVTNIKQRNISIQELERKKEKALERINSILKSDSLHKYGTFANKHLASLRKNIIQYEIFDKALGDNRMFTRSIESVVANSNKKLSQAKIGEFIDDVGLVIQKTSIYDKQKKQNINCFVVFNKEERDFSLRLIKVDDDEYEKIFDEFTKEYDSIKKELKLKDKSQVQIQLNELEAKAIQILAIEKSLEISKIHFNTVPLKNLEKFFAEMKQPEKVKNLINNIASTNKNKITLIVDYVNSDSVRYYEAGRKVALPLIQLLKIHDCNDVFIIARAIGENKKSPLPMYLRAGFVPISPTMDEIRQMTENFHKSFNPKSQIYMYLPNDAMVNKLVEKEEPLQEIFKFKN